MMSFHWEPVSYYVFDQCLHLAVAMTTIRSVCPKCGATKKSGKLSCCGRGGSWFGKCGNTVNLDLDHTWHEGLQVCKALSQSNEVIAQQLIGAQQGWRDFPKHAGTAPSEAVITAPTLLASTAAPIPYTPPAVIVPADASANTSTAHAASQIKSTPNAELVAPMSPMLVNKPMPTSDVTIADVSLSSANVLRNASVYTPVPSHASELFLGITTHTSLVLVFTFLLIDV